MIALALSACGEGDTTLTAEAGGGGTAGGRAGGSAGAAAGGGGTGQSGRAGSAAVAGAGGAAGSVAGNGGTSGGGEAGAGAAAGDSGSGGAVGGGSGSAGEAGAGAGGGGAGGESGSSGSGAGASAGGTSGAAGVAGAGGSGGTAGAGGAGIDIPTGGACKVRLTAEPVQPSPHLQTCSYIPYTVSNPPSSGPHYPTWAAFKTYPQTLPRGFWVHDLEHGAVVIAYNCPFGCEAEVKKAQATIDAFVDPKCAGQPGGSQKRVTMTPDPTLDSLFAVVAWGHTLKADCVDDASFSAFMKAHLDQAPESFCSEGVDVISAGLPDKCGEMDFVAPPTP